MPRGRLRRSDCAGVGIKRRRSRRGGPPDLLVYREGREWRDVRSDDVNAYIREHAGEGFSAKDFRTWHGTVLAALELAAIGPAPSRSAAERSIRRAIERVAEALGNTPAVCRRSYVDPRVLDRYREGVTIAAALPGNGKVSMRAPAKVERAVLELIS